MKVWEYRNVATDLPVKNMSYRGHLCSRWERRDLRSKEHRQNYPEYDGHEMPRGYKNYGRPDRYQKPHQQPRFPDRRNNDNFWKSRERHSQRSLKQTSDKKLQEKQQTDRMEEQRVNGPEYERFRALVKKIFDLIRSFHHLEKISIGSEIEPPTFSRLTRYLAGVIKPASMTPQTKTLLEGNAKNWAYTARLILQDHYELHVDQGSEMLQNMMIEDWSSALTIATKWYHRRYAKKCTESPIKKVEALLEAYGQSGVEREAEREKGTPTLSIEEFPPLSRDTGNLSSGTPQTGSPAPSTPPPLSLPQRAPRVNRTKQVFPKKTARRGNPAIICTDDHPELLTIQTCPDTQGKMTLPLIQERQATPRCTTPTLVQVHAHQDASLPNEERDQGPLIILDEQPEVIHSVSLIDSPCLGPGEDLEGSLLLEPLIDQGSTPISPTADTPKTFRPVKHLLTAKKIIEWGLSVRKKWCILGDSNVGRITDYHFEHLQIDSYPGATFRHAENIINKAQVHVKVEIVILAFGINHRNQKFKETAIKQIQRALKAARDKFPEAIIEIPLINFARTLKHKEQVILENINDHVQRNMPYLPLLPTAQFKVNSDQIHWTPTCAKAMLRHWAQHLNFMAL